MNPTSDLANCGGCGNDCSRTGACSSCAGGFCLVVCIGGNETVCNGRCVDPMIDTEFCGAGCDCQDAAGVHCDAGSFCLQGVCTPVSVLGD